MSPISFRRKTIRSDQTLGERLQSARTVHKLTLDDAEEQTHVRWKYLAALEQGRFDDLPEEVYAVGFVHRYAQFLGLDPAEAVTQYRCERMAARKLGLVPEQLPAEQSRLRVNDSVREVRWAVTPKLFWLGASLLVIFAIAGYIWYQVSGFMSAPQLDLAQLQPQMTVSSPTISIQGTTEGFAQVTINAEPVATDPNGNFQQDVHLAPGLNTIEIAARNRLNKETKKQIRVVATYNPVAPN